MVSVVNLPVLLKVLFMLYDERSEEAIVACVCENAIISIVNECTGKEVMVILNNEVV